MTFYWAIFAFLGILSAENDEICLTCGHPHLLPPAAGLATNAARGLRPGGLFPFRPLREQAPDEGYRMIVSAILSNKIPLNIANGVLDGLKRLFYPND